jgi:hypothetical protein
VQLGEQHRERDHRQQRPRRSYDPGGEGVEGQQRAGSQHRVHEQQQRRAAEPAGGGQQHRQQVEELRVDGRLVLRVEVPGTGELHGLVAAVELLGAGGDGQLAVARQQGTGDGVHRGVTVDDEVLVVLRAVHHPTAHGDEQRQDGEDVRGPAGRRAGHCSLPRPPEQVQAEEGEHGADGGRAWAQLPEQRQRQPDQAEGHHGEGGGAHEQVQPGGRPVVDGTLGPIPLVRWRRR